MANSRYEYVRSFELPDVLLANTWIVVRIDGRGFSKFTTKYKFAKPNDRRALDLMNAAAEAVMKELPDLVLAYGNSDEFSFVFHKDCVLFERRARYRLPNYFVLAPPNAAWHSRKLTTTIVSTFTSYYTFLWQTYFPAMPLTPPLPSFDGRAVCYPSDQNLRDYMSWRQVDCHINNLYNTSFWALVQQGGMDPRAAERELSGTISSDKNEILFSRFAINYNNEPEIFKKGSVLYRDFFPVSTQSSPMPPKAARSPPPLSHPQPTKLIAGPMSQPTELATSDLLRHSPSSAASTPRGPTFLSTSTTPSPPPSPRSMSTAALPNLLQAHPDNTGAWQSSPQTSMPVSPRSNGSLTSHNKQPLPILTPLPLPPPILKPSTKPPHSLCPPNPTAHTNTSPVVSPRLDFTIPDRKSSNHSRHTASASLPFSMPSSGRTAQPMTIRASGPAHMLKHRSPSLSILEGKPPTIPLRMSSIPIRNSPRKLSLPSHKSNSMLKQEEREKDNSYLNNNGRSSVGSASLKTSPPLMTMKELPSPPTDVEEAVRKKVMGSSPSTNGRKSRSQTTTSTPSPRNTKDMHTFPRDAWKIGHDASPPPPQTQTPPVRHKSVGRPRSHSRLHSAPAGSYFPPPPNHHPSHQGQDYGVSSSSSSSTYLQRDGSPLWPPSHVASTSTTTTPTQQQPTSPYPQPLSSNKPSPKPPSTALPPPPSSATAPPKPSRRSIKLSHKIREEGGWAAGTGTMGGDGRPVEMSKTQKEKDRKKRTKAKVVIEHVDLIKDEFWEKRVWILSGRAG